MSKKQIAVSSCGSSQQAVSTVPASIPDAEHFFPFTLKARERPHGTESPRSFRSAFLRNRPKDKTWYAYDVEIMSQTRVRFHVYGMLDFCRGGIGNKEFEFDAEVSAEETARDIEQRTLALATTRRSRELANAEEAIISRYAAELAQAIEARRAETGTGSVHESAVGNADAP